MVREPGSSGFSWRSQPTESQNSFAASEWATRTNRRNDSPTGRGLRAETAAAVVTGDLEKWMTVYGPLTDDSG